MRQRLTQARINLLTRAAPRSVYVVDLRGHNAERVREHLRRCCGPALCCGEQIAEMMDGQRP